MGDTSVLKFIKEVVDNMPEAWLTLTTHRLDIYDESRAKFQFLEQLETLFDSGNAASTALAALPTAYDYIRLGHPLSCLLEWGLARLNDKSAEHVISFSSKTIPVMAILRKNLLEGKASQIAYSGALPAALDAEVLHDVYGYQFELVNMDSAASISAFDGSTIYLSEQDSLAGMELNPHVDFYVTQYAHLGAILMINGQQNEHYTSDIQHVRRRETIAMTPLNCLTALRTLTSNAPIGSASANHEVNKDSLSSTIKSITGTDGKVLVASSGLSMQYAIVMGLIDDANKHHQGKPVKIVVPTNCYGGTNDQARRVAACIDNVEVVDLAVDGGSDMVQSIDSVLDKIAKDDAVPYIIAEIPTNPRVEVPDLQALQATLMKSRDTDSDTAAIAPVFILDQTFCPNIHFLGEGEILSAISAISYASGSKFPSGGKCTAGYCVGNQKATSLMDAIARHLELCDNEATDQQVEILAQQMPSMNQRIQDAYKSTREFVSYIQETLPEAKINFVSEKLASQGFTPSVFSLDLPTKGDTAEEKESYKRALNHTLIKLMITEIPNESKYCVSYGQLKGCYWTIPATSTQGTTKEGDKDYIARVALSPDLDLDKHKAVFLAFAGDI